MDTERVASEPQAALTAERALHRRLLAGDPTAPSDLVNAYLEPLVKWLVSAHRRLDEHLLRDIACDLLLSLAERPQQYDPARVPLMAYLRMAARGDVLNALRSSKRRRRHEVVLSDVELAAEARNTVLRGTDDPAALVDQSQPLDPELRQVIEATCTPTERQVLQLMLDGERRTALYAEVLGISGKTGPEQAREVKRVKDRLQKRLRREVGARESARRGRLLSPAGGREEGRLLPPAEGGREGGRHG